MKSIGSELKNHIDTKLNHIIVMSQNTINVVENKAPCEEVLGHFNEIKEAVIETESLILAYQLENCLLPRLSHFRELVNVLNKFAHLKHGALIIIERTEDLTAYIKTGTLIDAVITSQLVESIFYPGNPLHDGAMIIKENRVAAAGCVLPISQRTSFEEGKPMGMRHRAALGLTEQTDAMVIVVSEETQKVSLAVGGRLYRLKKSDNIWKELHRVVEENPLGS